jgi:Cu+-exporting ATPase
MTTQTYKVNGMHCASCVALIEDKLKKISGVKSVSVKLTSEKAIVDFEDSPIDTPTLSNTISQFGYTLEDTVKKEHGNEQISMSGMNHGGHTMIDPSNEMKFVLPMVGFSFVMMIWQVLADKNIAPPMSETVYEFFHHLMPIFATIVLFGIGRKYIKAVWIFLKTRTANMDTLVGISTVVAFIYSFIVTAFEKSLAPYLDVSSNFYDVVIIVIGLIAFGQYLETKAKKKTNEALQKLASLGSKNALVVRNGKEIDLPIEKVEIGDVVIVKPNERIPLDGVIIEGSSSIDEANLTGEAIPVDRGIDDAVFAGTQNFQGILHIKVIKDPKDTALAHIIAIVENAQNSKAPVERMADKISGIFVYVVIGLSIATFIAWMIFGPASLGLTKAFAFAISTTMAVLVIACPCSLGLATPTAIIAGVGRGAERGILIKNAESLEKLSKVTAIVFDKTGTLTHNKLAIEGIYCKDKNHTCDEAHTNLHKSLIYSITKSSKHPVSESVANWLKENNVTSLQITNLVEVAGKGVKAQYQGTTYYLGSRSYISEVIKQSEKVIQEDFDSSRFENGRELYLSDDKEVLSLIKIHDTIKAEAKDEIIKLKKLGLKVVMATGDHKKTSDVVAKNLGIDYVYSDVAPEDKLNIVKELQSKGLKVAMIGDGVNDAPALAQADVAISMSDGSDIAIESSDIVLLRGDIQKVAEAIHLAQRTNKIVWQNLISSFAYNSIGLPIAGGILYPFFGFLLSPAIAGAIMAFESVTVVMNSLRIKSMKL